MNLPRYPGKPSVNPHRLSNIRVPERIDVFGVGLSLENGRKAGTRNSKTVPAFRSSPGTQENVFAPALCAGGGLSERAQRRAAQIADDADLRLGGSLSAVARQITGTRWNGLLFFGLTGRRDG
jgi:hypothetical protein